LDGGVSPPPLSLSANQEEEVAVASEVMVEGGVHLLAEDPTAFLAVAALFFEGVKLWVPVSVSDKMSEMKKAYERVMLLVLCAVTACVSLEWS